MIIKLPSWMPPWRHVLLVLVPLALIPLAVTSKEGRCAYVILTMAVYWMAEVVPIPVTSLIPVFAFPLLGVLSTTDICLVYMKETNMMFLGGLTVALAVEYCNLHKRIALFVILVIGQSPRRLMTGFMATTMFLSMWISNTASTAMMVPIVDAILQQLYQTRRKAPPQPREKEDPRIAPHHQSRDPIAGSVDDVSMVNYCQHNSGFSSEDTIPSNYEAEDQDRNITLSEEETVMFAPPPNEECRRLRDMCYLATAYAANLGGTGSITGTGPNLVIKGVMDSSFPDSNQINFATWMAYNVPGMLICVMLGWLWLQLLFVGFGKKGMLNSNPETDAAIARQLKQKYRALGRVTFHEMVVLILFVCLVLLWLFRSPGFMTGWADVFKYAFPDVKIADATPAMVIVFLLFIIPKNPKSFRNKEDPNNDNQPEEFEGCLSWEVVQSKIPWGIVLLLGGGFAMAEAADKSNMSVLIGEQLRALDVLPKEAIVFLVCLVTALVTEAASNTATASILLPVLKELTLGINVNPIYLMLPASLCCSYAFMLPVATAPNAIVFGAAGMRTITMVKAGIVMNLICVAVAMFMINTLGVAMFDLNNFPDWANVTQTTT